MGTTRTQKLPQQRVGFYWIVGCLLLPLGWITGCSGPQSTLAPAGQGAASIATLFWWMVAITIPIWLGVVGLAVYFIRFRPESHSLRLARWLIIGGGVMLPTAVLTILLVYGLALLPALVAPAPAGSLKISVIGEQWWWRVRYQSASGGAATGGTVVELANEIRLPLGEPVEFHLESADVIHSFWIPSLGGKMDMFPGRPTRLVLTPTRTGLFRGVCAEYCGTSHALMNFPVVVLEKEEFRRWLDGQTQPARTMSEATARRGQELFLAQGCNACHSIRGTPAMGVIGPDLTHVGSRLSLAADTLPNEPDAFRRWLTHTEVIKPDVHMPNFGMLPAEELQALATYLKGLE